MRYSTPSVPRGSVSRMHIQDTPLPSPTCTYRSSISSSEQEPLGDKCAHHAPFRVADPLAQAASSASRHLAQHAKIQVASHLTPNTQLWSAYAASHTYTCRSHRPPKALQFDVASNTPHDENRTLPRASTCQSKRLANANVAHMACPQSRF